MATFKLEHFGTPRNDQAYIADRNLYLNAEGKLVEEKDPSQVRQLVGKGGALSTETATKYGLKLNNTPEAREAAAKAKEADKKASTPAKDKGAKK